MTRPDDAIGWVTTRTPPAPNRCLELTIEHEPNDSHVAVSPMFGPPFGHGVMARSRDAEMRFIDPVPLPRDFVYATAIDATVVSGVPEKQRLGVYIVAVPDYRHSGAHLAYAAPGALADPTGRKFFTGRMSDGQPRVRTRGRATASLVRPVTLAARMHSAPARGPSR